MGCSQRKRVQEESETPKLPAPPIRSLSTMTLPPPVPTPRASLSAASPSANLEAGPILDRSVRSSSPMVMTTISAEPDYDDDEWGIRRERDAEYELLPVKTPREQLLGDGSSSAYGSGVGGAAQLHEELGSGLADVSAWTKLG